jgi:hypothetical protein
LKERLFLGDGRGFERSRADDFDPVVEGARYGLAPPVVVLLWERARREATDPRGRCDEVRARVLFSDEAQRSAAADRDRIGKTTQVEVAAHVPLGGNALARAPGKVTRVGLREAGVRSEAPGRTTLVASQPRTDEITPAEPRGWFRRAVAGGHAELAVLGHAIAAVDHGAALKAKAALAQHLTSAREHLARELADDGDGRKRELSELEQFAEQMLAKAPTMSRAALDAVCRAPRSWVRWDQEASEWRARTTAVALGERARADELVGAAAEPTAGITETRADGSPMPSTAGPGAALHERLHQTFGADARDVPVRADDGPVGAAEAVTVNETVFIGRWNDDELFVRMGHEVAHAIQQRRGRTMGGETDSAPISAARRASLEMEAEHAGHALVSGMPFTVQGSAPSGVALFRGGPAIPSAEPAASGAPAGADPDPKHKPDHPEPSRAGEAARVRDRGAEGGERSKEAEPRGVPPGQELAPEPAATPHADDAGAARATHTPEANGTEVGGGATTATTARAAVVDSSDPGALLDSLQHAPVSAAMPTLVSVHIATPGVFESMRKSAQEELPRIPTPTGLPARRGGDAQRAPQAEADAAPHGPAPEPPAPTAVARRAPDRLVHEAPAALPASPIHLEGGDQGARSQGHDQEPEDPALARSAQSALSGIQLAANQVPTRAAGIPTVDLHGEADASQLDAGHAASQQEVTAAATAARGATKQDRGERDIHPKEDPQLLEARLAARKTAEAREGDTRPPMPDAVPRDAMASIDAEATSILGEKIGIEHQRYTAGKAEQDAAKQAAHRQAQADIAGADRDARMRQIEAQVGARGEATAARAEWQREIEHIDSRFRSQASAAHDQHRWGIANEQQAANRRAAEHIQTAERQAEQEKTKAEVEATKKKDEGKQKSGGFRGWLRRKASALIDGIKAAVNVIYDGLRSAVKAIFDACKQLALAVIELARRTIIGLIKAFGAILKGLVKLALGAFPQLRDRILKRIDQAVHRAANVVNAIADQLKKAVTALIELLAKTIDKILGLIQGLYNAVLTVAGMLISGELQELLRKVGQLVASAKTAPGQFETAAYEELLGGNLDEPLSSAELIAAGRTPPSVADESAGTHDAAHHGPEGGDLPQRPWTQANVGADEIAHDETLDPELQQDIAQRTGHADGEIEFGESSDDSRSLEAILGTSHAPGAQPATPELTTAAPAYTDGLTPAERAKVKWDVMKQGLAAWWSKNWPSVLAGGVLAVAGFIVANILTGGAIVAALPVIMTAVGYLFTGLMVVQLAENLRDYLTKAWAGDLRGGGKSLAKGLAAAVIELITWLTVEAGSAALKGAKAAAKGAVRAAQAAGRGAAAAGKAIARVARAGAQYVIRAGKVLLRGAGRGIGRAVKRIKELGVRLLARTKFRGFRIRIAQRRWTLEGRINPWVLLASGRIVEIKELPEDAKVGSMVDDVVDGQPGRVVATGREPPDAADVARVIGDAKPSPPEVQRALRKLEREAERIAELERKQAGGRRLSQQENQELRELSNKVREPVPLSESDAFREARSDATRVMPSGATVSPRELPYLEQAQRLMNELNKPGATFGDGSVAMSILGEQVAGGQTARAILGDTLHFAKGVDHLQPLYRLAQSGKLPGPAASRLIQEARKIEEAVAWARQYSRAVAGGTAALDDLPEWAQAYRELLQGLRP